MPDLLHHLTATAGLLWLLVWYATFGLLLALFRAVRDAVLVAVGIVFCWKFDRESEAAAYQQGGDDASDDA